MIFEEGMIGDVPLYNEDVHEQGDPAPVATLKAQGVAYVLLFGQGSRENMRRFAETVMPGFAAE